MRCSSPTTVSTTRVTEVARIPERLVPVPRLKNFARVRVLAPIVASWGWSFLKDSRFGSAHDTFH